MAVRRVVPNVQSQAAQESREFYELLGFEEVMNHGWIMTLASPSSPTAQISFMAGDKTAPGLRPWKWCSGLDLIRGFVPASGLVPA